MCNLPSRGLFIQQLDDMFESMLGLKRSRTRIDSGDPLRGHSRGLKHGKKKQRLREQFWCRSIEDAADVKDQERWNTHRKVGRSRVVTTRVEQIGGALYDRIR